MNVCRRYGKPPYRAILVHGGPGAVGEMKPVASMLANHCGVLESLNKSLSINGQLNELMECIKICQDKQSIIIGFSWGAWLSIIFTAKHSDLIKKLILIGCGPLEQQYAKQVYETRLNRLEVSARNEFIALLTGIENNEINDRNTAFEKLSKLVRKADSYEPIEDNNDIEIIPDVFKAVWSKASKLRKDGLLIHYLNKITCPIVAIQGDYDPHPAEGILLPLQKSSCTFEFELLKKCGHKPWIESKAQETFYKVLIRHVLDI